MPEAQSCAPSPKASRQRARGQPKRHRLRPGAVADAEASSAEAVRKACRSLQGLQQAFEKFSEEALDLVAEKIRLLTTASQGPVGRALAQHPGSQERILEQLVSRLEGFHTEGMLLHQRFEKQNGGVLQQSLEAVRLWQHRREVGAPFPCPCSPAESDDEG
ncbi:Uncharacterized protein SCF082_LOCUS12347, partial [Durusdinium trenchii]